MILKKLVIMQIYDPTGLSKWVLFNSTNFQLGISVYMEIETYKLKCR